MTALLRHTTPSLKFRALGLLLAMVASPLVVVSSGCRGGPGTVLTELSEANRLAVDLRIQFNKSADASNRAVMAVTDQASIDFAHDAEQTATLVGRDVTALSALLRSLGVRDEIPLLEQFEKHFSEYQKVDHNILALAVENTNLKAQALSFGPAREAADRFKAALGAPAPRLAPNDRCRAESLVEKAVLAVRELQTLEGPHIASPDDAAMTGIEKEMATLDSAAADALNALPGLVEPSALAAAQTAFTQLKSIESQIVSLSRRNSNVVSLDLALRVKPPLTAACDDSLRALQQALANEGYKATR